MKITQGSLATQLILILRANAPVRGEAIPAGRKMPKNYMRPTKLSPYPGNLRNNAFRITQVRGYQATLSIGDGVPYALRTEKTSFKKGWIAKSRDEFLARCIAYGGRIK